MMWRHPVPLADFGDRSEVVTNTVKSDRRSGITVIYCKSGAFVRITDQPRQGDNPPVHNVEAFVR